VALVVLGLLNVYVLYWRRGTSVPALWDLASAGRRASLGARLQGPVGSPPMLSGRAKHSRVAPPLPDYPRVVDIALSPGDTVHGVLQAAGHGGRVLGELESSLQSLLDPGGLGAGQTLTLYYDGEDRLSTVDYRLTPALAYHLERVQTGGAERFVSTRQPDSLSVRVTAVQATLDQPAELVAALGRAGETPALAARLAELFACELNLYSDTRAGDRLRVVVEKHSLGSRLYRYGRLLAAEYVPAPGGPRTARLRAFLAPGNTASNAGAGLGAASQYFTENGESLARALCRSPLQWSRVAAAPLPAGGPQQAAADPALARPHLHAERGRLGMDYPAPAGTPVLAAGAGKVIFHGAHGPQGNTVVLSHAGGTETSYQHLLRVARGLTDGQTVRLRQVIGYVGQSGQAGKPHLHFAVRVNGKLVDPSRLRSPREAPLPASQRAALAQQVAQSCELLAHIGEPAAGDVLADLQ
jgi:murein DD-endopeptidase MepM/ murein hydrolase activator NlpD